jgi:hypothetical protein
MMKYQILDEKSGKRFIFNKEDLSKLPPEIIQELTCFFYNPENEASFFIFNITEADQEIIQDIITELESQDFELIRE